MATNTQAGARIGQISFADADSCDLRGEISVADSYDAKLVLYGDPDGTPLPKDFLIKPENRLIAKNEDGSIAVDEPLCGVCTGIRDDKVSIVLPLSTGALFRAAKSVEMTVKLGDTKACGFTLNCEDLRKALDWAVEKKEALAKSLEDDKCVPPAKGCFLTTACCEVLGLPDDCFELRTLRRYRDETLAAMPGGNAAIAAYYRIGALDPRPASARRPRHAPSLGLCALHPAERHRGAAWAQRSRLSSLCSDDGRAGARLRAGRCIASVSPPSDIPFSPSRAHCRSRATCQALSLGFAAIRPKWRPSRRLRSCLTKSERFAANGVQSKTRDADRGLAAGLRDAGGCRSHALPVHSLDG